MLFSDKKEGSPTDTCTTWMNLGNITLGEIYMKYTELIETETVRVGEEEIRATAKGYGASFWGNGML